MKKFVFRLERVLSYRALCREEARRALTEARFNLHQCEERIESLTSALLANEPKGAGSGSALGFEAFELSRRYTERLRAEIAHEEARRTKLAAIVDERISEYVTKASEHRAIELLKERRRREYLEKASRAEDQFLDEMSILRRGIARGANHDTVGGGD